MLSSRAEGSFRLDQLAARPPTPPKESSKKTATTNPFSPDTNKAVDDALRFLDEGHRDISAAQPSPRLNGSTDTPPSKAPASSTRGSTASKKVGFLLEPTGQTTVVSCSPRTSHESPALRTSGPLKSILKRSIERLPPTPDDVEDRLSVFSPQEPGSFRKMLQSVLKQLGGTSRDGRRDAYLCLNGALKQHSDLPDRDALVDKIDLLQQFLTRDMAWKDAKGVLDLQIVTQALNLTSALLWDPVTAGALDDDLRAFIVDRSMLILEQPDSPKPVIKAHLHILMVQQFASSIMTQNKTERIVAALQNIEERCSGNSVISARLAVYQRLASQQPPVMISKMHDWMGHLLAGMLSSINDTRLRAIDVSNHIALHLGSYPSASRTLFEIFDTETDEGIPYGKHFNAKLMEMVSDKELAHFVPQIWASIILFCRTKRKPIDRWPMLKTFLATMQRCLNSGDMTVKHWAHIAWSKLIFVVSPDSATTPSMRSMLRLPMVALLDKRGNDRFSLQAKELGLFSYNYLLHYGLRPSLSHEELDGAWKLYVEDVLPKLTQSSRREQTHVCHVLQGLLQRKKNLWNENAAVETATQIKPQDLPPLDAKWIRSRLGRILAILEPIITAGMCSPPESNQAANTSWRLLFQAVADAGSQEVKASNELKVALAEVINFLRRLWHSSATSRSKVEASLWLDRYQLLLGTCVETLGAGHFVEDFLAKTNADEVEATPTPSNRTSKHQKTAYSPFVFLFALYYQPPQDDQSNEAYRQSAAWYLNLLAGARGSTSGTIGLLHRSLQFCSDQNPPRQLGEQLWGASADHAACALKQTSNLPQHNAQTVGVALRSALNIITFGLRTYPSSSSCSQKATELYEATCNFAKHYGNAGGVALGVMEPLAKSLLDMRNDLSVACAVQVSSCILDHGVWPKSRQDLEHSRKALWSVSLDPPSKASASIFDPFDHLYKFIDAISLDAYNQLSQHAGAVPGELLIGYLTVLIRFIQECPDKILPSSLRRIQSAAAVFAEDRNRAIFPLLAHKINAQLDKIANALPSLWAEMLGLVQDVATRYDSILLEGLEPLLVAGLSSPSKDVVNKTITFWNESFGAQDFLEYPQNLLAVVRARRVDADIQLPGLSDDENDVELAELPAFAESQAWLGPKSSSNLTNGRSPKPLSKSSKSPFSSPSGTPEALAAKRARPSKTSTPKARLRHDDSQLQFAPIESSSATRSSNEASQLLTEHQKEVKARQHGDAQMFPELSSSPGQTGHNRNAIAKKLDFSSDAHRGEGGNEEVATPVGLADGNPMSDDLPSSPTPRASAAAQQVEQYSDDDATDIIDPPSSPPSPPRQSDYANGVAALTDATTTITDDGSAEPQANLEQLASTAIEGASKVAASDLVSDTLLPTAQLEREAAAAEAQKRDHPVHEDESANDESMSQPSRIVESFVERIDEVASPGDITGNATTPQGSRSKRKKRQRLQSEEDTPRKRAKNTSPSPIKDLWKRLTSNQPVQDVEDDEDDDADVQEMRDVIVVTTQPPSQRMQEPEPEPRVESQEEKHIKRRRGRPRKSYFPAKEPEPVTESQEQSEQPVKRGRGRPRKNSLTDSSQTLMNAGQKRRASVVSNATTEEGTSLVAGTPAGPTTRKAARLHQGAPDAGSSLRRAVAQEEDEAVEPQEGSNLSAKTMLSKLYGMLADIPKMVFGSQDERAFDDVLFEFRREVHEAGRRGREQENE